MFIKSFKKKKKPFPYCLILSQNFLKAKWRSVALWSETVFLCLEIQTLRLKTFHYKMARQEDRGECRCRTRNQLWCALFSHGP